MLAAGTAGAGSLMPKVTPRWITGSASCWRAWRKESGCGHAAQERLVEWYRGWFALGWERSPALASAQTMRTGLYASGGFMACLWRRLAGAGSGIAEAAILRPGYAAELASVLVLGGLWRTGEHVPTVIKRWIRASNPGDSAAHHRLEDRCMAALQRAFMPLSV